MAEKRCPMCGKPNPEDAEICQFCDARLTPIIQPGETPMKKDTSEFEGAGYRERLAQQGTIAPGDAPTKQDTKELEQALPAWLRQARNPEQPQDDVPSEAQPEDESAPVMPDEPSADSSLPGWLSDLTEDAKPEQGDPTDFLSGLASLSDEDDEEDVSGWLADLRGGDDSLLQPEVEAQLQPLQEQDQSESDDWFSRLGGEDSPLEPPAVPVESATDDDQFDWMANLQGEAETPAPSGAQFAEDGETLNWLDNLQAESESPAAPAPVESLDESPSDEVPSWLADMQAEADQQAAAESQQSSVSGDAPNWLSGFAGEEEAPTEPAAMETSVEQASDEVPPWLADMQAKTAQPAVDSEPPVIADEGEHLNWLSGLSAESESEESIEEAPADTPMEMAEDIPSWLAGMGSESASQPATATPAFVTAEEVGDENLDWLGSLQAEDTPEEVVQAELPSESGEDASDWLASLDSNAASEAPSASPFVDFDSGGGDELEAAELPPWLADAKAAAPVEETPTSDADLFSMDMPEWASETAQSETFGAAVEPFEDIEDEDLRPADLPNWVQAMRPVESVLGESSQAVSGEKSVAEERGPLAGLVDVLPAGVLPTGRPRPYTAKLKVSDTQQAGVSILESILASETQPKPIRSTQKVLSARILRWLVALVLLLTLGGTSVFSRNATPMFAYPPNEILAVRSWVDSGFSIAAPVLLVFDYEPAFSGELEAASAPVLDHLAIRGAHLALLSTSPTGPALAERSMSVLQAIHTYQPSENYVNLGYLPGGASGILAFAQQPNNQGWADAWSSPVLAEKTKHLTDFAAIFVITDSVETGQQWVEQTTATRGDTPIFMVISAQAEPMLLPYYQSGQVKGMVTGLAGGAAYETNINRSGLGRRYWDAYSMGLFVSVILIVIGVIWSMFASWMARRGKEKA